MSTSRITREARLRAVLVSSGVGALAGAGWPLPATFGNGTATRADVLEWAVAGFLLSSGVAAVCVEAFSRVRRRSLLIPLGMVTGLVLAAAMALWILRGDSDKNDALLGRGILGLILGLVVAIVVGALLARPSENPDSDRSLPTGFG